MPNQHLKLPNREMAGALLARVRHAHRAWRASGISPLDHLVLLEVAAENLRRPPSGCTGADCARALGVSKPTASRRLKGLMRGGWVTHTKGQDHGYWITQKAVDAAAPLLGSLLNNLEVLRKDARVRKKVK